LAPIEVSPAAAWQAARERAARNQSARVDPGLAALGTAERRVRRDLVPGDVDYARRPPGISSGDRDKASGDHATSRSIARYI
jgi:hypothetical protein